MSAGQIQYEMGRAMEKNQKDVSAACTLKTGRDDDYFQIDNPVKVTVGDDYTITVPDGVHPGQEIFLWCAARTSGAATVDTTNGDNATLDAAGEFAVMRWTNSTIGWKKVAYATGV